MTKKTMFTTKKIVLVALLAALTVGIPALKWFLRWKKQAKLAANQPKVSERTESNGP